MAKRPSPKLYLDKINQMGRKALLTVCRIVQADTTRTAKGGITIELTCAQLIGQIQQHLGHGLFPERRERLAQFLEEWMGSMSPLRGKERSGRIEASNHTCLSYDPRLRRSTVIAHLQAIARILDDESDPQAMKTLEEIELTVRQQIQTHVSPELGGFLSKLSQERKLLSGEGSKVLWGS